MLTSAFYAQHVPEEKEKKDHAKKLKQQTNKLATAEAELAALQSR